MNKRTGRNCSDEFKEEAVKLIAEQGYSIAETSRNLGINVNLLGRSKRGFEQLSDKPIASGNISAMQ